MKNRKAFTSFNEYLTAKNKVQTKPPIEKLPDYKGPKPAAPAKAVTKGKGWEVPNVGKKGAPAAYSTSGKGRPAQKAEKGGFAHMGDKALVYDPADDYGTAAVSKKENGVTGGKNAKTWPKVGKTTESFLAGTEGMSTSQFAKHVKKGLNEHESKKAPHVVAYSAGTFHPDPIQAIRYVTYLANENANLRHALIRESSRAGCASAILEELLLLPESYTALARIINSENGESFSRRLDKAIRENRDENRKKAKIHEEVDEPAHDDDLDVDNVDKSELDLGDDDEDKEDGDDLDLDGDEGDDEDEEGDDEDGDDLNLGGDEEGGDDNTPPPPPKDGDDAGGDLDLGGDDAGDDAGSDDAGGDLNLGGDEEGGDDHPPMPDDAHTGSHDDDADGDDLDFDADADDEGDEGDEGDLDGDDEDDEDEDEDAPPHGKKKMPWEDD